ncbi:MAG TPA: hypothetical protein VI893_01250, partial [Thermoplasmata archaeon]|nr:hypothetical protein [Thermoplasmata archaeon]
MHWRTVLVSGLMFVSALAMPLVGATGWASATVEPDRPVYRMGERSFVWINGTDSDTLPDDNQISVYVFDGQGNQVRQWLNVAPGGPTQEGPYLRNFILTGQPGLWNVRVHDASTANQVGTGSFLVLAVGGVLELEPSIYTGTDTYVPGETITIKVVGAQPNAQHDLAVAIGTRPLQNGSVTTDSVGNAQTTYPLPETAEDGRNANGEDYSVQLSGPTTDGAVFQVKKFRLTIGTERSGYLTGETAKAHYLARMIKDNTPVTAGSGEWRLVRQGGGFPAVRSGTFPTSAGSFDIALSGLEVARYRLEAWFNSTGSPPPNFAYDEVNVDVGVLGMVFARPGNFSTVTAGGTVNVEVVAYVAGFGVSGLPGATVKVDVVKDGNIEAAYSASGLVTSGTGSTGYAFQVSAAEVEGKQLRIEATATKGTESTKRWLTVTVSKTSVPGLQVAIELDRSDYLSGEKLSAVVRGSVEAQPTKYNYVYTVYRSGPGPGACGGNIIIIEPSNSNKFEFPLAQDLEGTFRLCVDVSDGTGNETSDDAVFSVTYARLLVNADRLTYERAGEVINFNFALVAKDSGEAKYFYEVRDATGALMLSDIPSGNGFSFSIPANPTRTYAALVSASIGGHLVTGSVTLSQVVGIKLHVWVITPSSLASGAFQPGENLRLGFEFYSVGGAPLPTVFRVDYSTSGRDDDRSSLGSAPKGELGYTVPSDAGDGTVVVGFAGTPGTGTPISDVLVLNVDRDANPLDLRLAGGISLFHL